MKHRVCKDDISPALYWVERQDGDNWVKVFGTTTFEPEIAEVMAENYNAGLTKDEIEMLLGGL